MTTRFCEICGRDLPTLKWTIRQDGKSRSLWLCHTHAEPLASLLQYATRTTRPKSRRVSDIKELDPSPVLVAQELVRKPPRTRTKAPVAAPAAARRRANGSPQV